MRASRKADLDEAKFASVTAGMVLRKGNSSPPAHPADGAMEGGVPDGFFARKGEAAPSTTSMPSPWSEPAHPGSGEDHLHLRDELTRLQFSLAEREAALSDAEARLAAAEQNWKAAEAARL